MGEQNVVIVEGGRVYQHDGDTDAPSIADILILGDRIAAVEPDIGERLRAGGGHPALPQAQRPDRWIDARGKLILPGFMSAHYHSHDVLLRGSFEPMPLDLWLMNATPPSYPPRSREEVYLRTLAGAVDCLRGGITTVQDMLTIFPFSTEHVDAALQAYQDIGLRCVFSMQIADTVSLKTLPYWEECVPADLLKTARVSAEPYGDRDVGEIVEEVYQARRGTSPLIHWALGPASPERCSRPLMERLADLSRRERLPIYTHIYENKGKALAARQHRKEYDGSLVKYMESTGMAGPLVSLAHTIWIRDDEIDRLAESGTNVVLCPASNMKSKSGVAPVRSFVDKGVKIAIGTDNCACSDTQNAFHSMKLFVGLAAISELEPGPPYARDAIYAATEGSARTAGLEGQLGAIKTGRKADLVILDMSDPSYLPFNSAARQVVFSEAGRAVETVVVDGQVVVQDRRLQTIDEAALHEAVATIMPAVRRDRDVVSDRVRQFLPHVMEAERRVWAHDVGVHSYVGGHKH